MSLIGKMLFLVWLSPKYSKRVIVEKFITGFDFRILVIDNKLVANENSCVIGNGKNSIQELIALKT
jgi:cyanophycin synthetase